MKNTTLITTLPVFPDANSAEGCVLGLLLTREDICRQHLPRSIRFRLIDLIRRLKHVGWPIVQMSFLYNEEWYRLEITPWDPGFRWSLKFFQEEANKIWGGQ